jgi:hypothetical protein
MKAAPATNAPLLRTASTVRIDPNGVPQDTPGRKVNPSRLYKATRHMYEARHRAVDGRALPLTGFRRATCPTHAR